jgi:hypothetical protein
MQLCNVVYLLRYAYDANAVDCSLMLLHGWPSAAHDYDRGRYNHLFSVSSLLMVTVPCRCW